MLSEIRDYSYSMKDCVNEMLVSVVYMYIFVNQSDRPNLRTCRPELEMCACVILNYLVLD